MTIYNEFLLSETNVLAYIIIDLIQSVSLYIMFSCRMYKHVNYLPILVIMICWCFYVYYILFFYIIYTIIVYLYTYLSYLYQYRMKVRVMHIFYLLISTHVKL